MSKSARTMAVAVALTASLGLTACNDDTPPETTTTESSAAESSEQTSPETPSEESEQSPESSQGESSPTSGESEPSADDSGSGEETDAPASGRDDKGDKSALDATQSSIPEGPMTQAKIIKMGGYSTSAGRGEFYAVLSVDSSGPGLVDVEYELLDDSGEVIGTVKDNFAVSKGKNVIKVTRSSGEAPASTKKVRMKVTKNQKNSYATVTEIDPTITTSTDPDSKVPVLKGKYRTVGKASVVTLNAICSDANGVVQTANSPVDKIKAPEWTPFEIKMLLVKDGFTPKTCYVGS